MNQINFINYLYKKIKIIIVSVILSIAITITYAYFSYNNKIKAQVVITPPQYIFERQIFKIEDTGDTAVNLDSDFKKIGLEIKVNKKNVNTLIVDAIGQDIAVIKDKIKQGILAIEQRYKEREKNIDGSRAIRLSTENIYNNIEVIKLDRTSIYLKYIILSAFIGFFIGFGLIYILAFKEALVGNEGK